jgi:hypothetical protein
MARLAGVLGCVLGALLGTSCSPFGGGAFDCTLDTQCGAAGKCSTGFCSFPDDHCDSGYRYGEASGPSSNQCVGDGMRDGSVATDDTLTDTMGPPSDSNNCFGTGLVTACFAAAPTGAKVLSGDIDTGTSGLCDTDPRNDDWCVIAGASISVPGTVHVTGTKPLVLVATGTIDIPGALDSSSKRATGQVGAASLSCSSVVMVPGASSGGAGGSFGTKGGNGGGGAGAATGGTAGDAVSPTTLRGGCRGQDGNGTNKGAGGGGGGALYLISNTSITVGGSINASGAGGSAGTTNASGGGGGGAGGFIGLDAPTVSSAGTIIANGGGGGEGSGSVTPGNPGGDVTGLGPAAGGSAGSATGGDGGNGATGTLDPTAGGSSNNGGGGGGGGVGIVRLDRAASIGGGGTVSPAPT